MRIAIAISCLVVPLFACGPAGTARNSGEKTGSVGEKDKPEDFGGFQPSAVYGNDSRLDPYMYLGHGSRWQRTPIRVHVDDLIDRGSTYELRTERLGPRKNLCSGERFYDQPSVPGACTGFMIGSDLLITAGHCVAGKDLSKYRWVFGFRYSNASSVVVKIPKADVKIATLWKIPSDYAPTTRSDWAALKLATPVGVWFMPRRSQEKIANHWPVYMYGYPNGLPYKLANDAMVLENSDPYLFRTSLDAFQGNSGSPVLSDRLHIVEGILVGGEDDYVQEGTCYKVKTCPLNGEGCRKELVVRIAPVVAALGK